MPTADIVLFQQRLLPALTDDVRLPAWNGVRWKHLTLLSDRELLLGGPGPSGFVELARLRHPLHFPQRGLLWYALFALLDWHRQVAARRGLIKSVLPLDQDQPDFTPDLFAQIGDWPILSVYPGEESQFDTALVRRIPNNMTFGDWKAVSGIMAARMAPMSHSGLDRAVSAVNALGRERAINMLHSPPHDLHLAELRTRQGKTPEVRLPPHWEELVESIDVSSASLRQYKCSIRRVIKAAGTYDRTTCGITADRLGAVTNSAWSTLAELLLKGHYAGHQISARGTWRSAQPRHAPYAPPAFGFDVVQAYGAEVNASKTKQERAPRRDLLEVEEPEVAQVQIPAKAKSLEDLTMEEFEAMLIESGLDPSDEDVIYARSRVESAIRVREENARNAALHQAQTQRR